VSCSRFTISASVFARSCWLASSWVRRSASAAARCASSASARARASASAAAAALSMDRASECFCSADATSAFFRSICHDTRTHMQTRTQACDATSRCRNTQWMAERGMSISRRDSCVRARYLLVWRVRQERATETTRRSRTRTRLVSESSHLPRHLLRHEDLLVVSDLQRRELLVVEPDAALAARNERLHELLQGINTAGRRMGGGATTTQTCHQNARPHTFFTDNSR
jgi:hypothetical protein